MVSGDQEARKDPEDTKQDQAREKEASPKHQEQEHIPPLRAHSSIGFLDDETNLSMTSFNSKLYYD